jgi:hypothetical protein
MILCELSSPFIRNELPIIFFSFLFPIGIDLVKNKIKYWLKKKFLILDENNSFKKEFLVRLSHNFFIKNTHLLRH